MFCAVAPTACSLLTRPFAFDRQPSTAAERGTKSDAEELQRIHYRWNSMHFISSGVEETFVDKVNTDRKQTIHQVIKTHHSFSSFRVRDLPFSSFSFFFPFLRASTPIRKKRIGDVGKEKPSLLFCSAWPSISWFVLPLLWSNSIEMRRLSFESISNSGSWVVPFLFWVSFYVSFAMIQFSVMLLNNRRVW